MHCSDLSIYIIGFILYRHNASLQTQLRLNSTGAPRTFDNHEKLPRLPIPSLQNLADKYLSSCKPLLSSELFSESETRVKEFIAPNGLGERLQERLIEHDLKEPVESNRNSKLVVGGFLAQSSLFRLA
ncbi:hypothetical protein BDEG_26611 [Batrachochytrium dendrobatidis JEL423]|uniref:Choline/carnitine acyltransferase domain-containing protein n=1 Tax=Batrachochytrium dendrobatidis (strain JEL423) TaxID=403673 RepID=A0A177WSX0_BATDL|nr:hypothetical protein BDEG_26611 [Batrachochytrium dendrobatidis JEL423]